MKRFVAFAAFAALLAVVGSKTVGADGGNSTSAKACQKGGWLDLMTASGDSFTSAGDCTSYAAHGGTPVRKGPSPALFKSFCESTLGDTFTIVATPQETDWSCGQVFRS